MAKLAEEIKMRKPFSQLEEEAALSIMRTADLLSQRTLPVLRGFDLSGSQYNVLRILRGSPEGLPCGQIAERMISRDPDVTRLLDRMEARGLIRRERSEQDRRVVTARITAGGLELLKQADPAITVHHRRQFEALGEKKLRRLIELMQEVREVSV